jgi:type VI secretion system protein ImpH
MRPVWGLIDELFRNGYDFDFFQAVRVLSRWRPPDRPAPRLVGRRARPEEEAVRFRAHLSLAFPPSTIWDVELPRSEAKEGSERLHPQVPRMTVTFMGLYGPQGTLPRHYTDRLLQLDRDLRTVERYSLRAWLDLFNHRLIALFYRTWEKYRFWMHFEAGEPFTPEPDPFTLAVLSFAGLGLTPLRNRVKVAARLHDEGRVTERELARVDDLALIYYAGMLAQRPRNAANLQALVADYFGLRVQVLQFQGQWLPLGAESLTRLGDANSALGESVVAGERVWDVGSKFRLRLGPVQKKVFLDLLPDPAPTPERKTFFLLVQLVRLYLGPELDFDVQVVLRMEDVPDCQMSDGGLGARLGWNTWVRSGPMRQDVDDAVFEGVVVTRVGH